MYGFLLGVVLVCFLSDKNLAHSDIFCFLSIVHLGINEDDPGTTGGSPSLSVYRYFFENVFLQTTEEYYSKESMQFLWENPVTEYMKKVSLQIGHSILSL